MQDSDGEKSDDNLVVDVSNEVCAMGLLVPLLIGHTIYIYLNVGCICRIMFSVIGGLISGRKEFSLL